MSKQPYWLIPVILLAFTVLSSLTIILVRVYRKRRLRLAVGNLPRPMDDSISVQPIRINLHDQYKRSAQPFIQAPPARLKTYH